mgnify:CR=1 FL=1
MDSIKTIAPILITKTKSFWLGAVPAAFSLLEFIFFYFQGDQAGPVAGALALILGPLFGWTADDITRWVQGVAPIYTFVVMWQRSGIGGGIPRPYTISPEKEQRIVKVIEDGKSAFEAGLQVGRAVKK